MRMGRALGTFADLAAMALVAVLVYFGWNPMMRYLPGKLINDVDAVLGWLGAEDGTTSRDWLRWTAEVEWLIGALVVVILFWAFEKLVALVRTADEA